LNDTETVSAFRRGFNHQEQEVEDDFLNKYVKKEMKMNNNNDESFSDDFEKKSSPQVTRQLAYLEREPLANIINNYERKLSTPPQQLIHTEVEILF